MNQIFKEGLSPELLEEMFRNDEKCYEFLANLKWADGFVCKKCGNTNSCHGKEPWSRRCTRCKTKETATNGTIFHGVKFPISKAFYIAYNVCKGKENISSYEFGRRLSLRQMTCWNFKTKIREAISEMDSLSETEKISVASLLNN